MVNFRDLFIGLLDEINISHSEELESINTFKYIINKKRQFNYYIYTIIMEIKFKSEEDYRNLFTCDYIKKFNAEGLLIVDEDFNIDNILRVEINTDSCIMCNIG